MKVRVRFFAVLRDKAGVDSTTLSLKEGATLRELKAALRKNYGEGIVNKSVAVAVNGEIVKDDYLLEHNDEVALLPPVSGGVC
jgi:molybdopterin converting factor subunit 1